MKLARQVFFPDAPTARQVMWWGIAVVAIPLALFILLTIWQVPGRLSTLLPVTGVSAWHEDLGSMAFDQEGLEALVVRPPNWSAMEWTPVELPNFVELGSSVDVPPDAPKRRVWFRIPIPQSSPESDHGRLALLGFRVQGGPWAVWVDGQLIQANLADWRIQWNIPLRVVVPMGARELLLAVPYVAPLGYSVGSMRIGPVDEVEVAWQERNLLQSLMPKLMMAISAVLAWVSFHLALLRKRDHTFRLMAVNALMLVATSVQWTFDVTGADELSLWFGSATDSSITWVVVLLALFAFEVEQIDAPRLRILLIVYACVSTVLTLPIWEWQKNALIAQQYLNVAVYAVVLWILGIKAIHRPTRSAVVLWVAMATQLGLGIHTLENLTNQTNPDSYYSFPITSLLVYIAFTYVLMRRSALAMNLSEAHEATLMSRLAEQEQRLARQHEQLQRLEVERRLASQHETIMQDLHDSLGSNLTSALLQARAGTLGKEETVMLLQDLTDELRHLSRSTQQDQRTLNQVLAEIRQRVEHRLRHGGIALDWAVDPDLPSAAGTAANQHLRALLSEAIANSIKHSGATRIRLEAAAGTDAVSVAIVDDGRGFDVDNAEAGRGLIGMRQRAESMGAIWSIESRPGEGTTVRLTLHVCASAARG